MTQLPASFLEAVGLSGTMDQDQSFPLTVSGAPTGRVPLGDPAGGGMVPLTTGYEPPAPTSAPAAPAYGRVPASGARGRGGPGVVTMSADELASAFGLAETTPQPAAPVSTASPTWGDYARVLEAGVYDIPQALGGLGVMMGLDGAEGLRDWAGGRAEDAIGRLTPQAKAAMDREIAIEDPEAMLGYRFQAPTLSQVGLLAARSAPSTAAMALPTIATGGAAGAVAAGAAGRAALTRGAGEAVARQVAAKAGQRVGAITAGATGGVAEGSLSAGQSQAEIEKRILELPLETIARSPRFQEIFDKTDPSLPEDIRSTLARRDLAREAANDKALWSGAAVGALSVIPAASLGHLATGGAGRGLGGIVRGIATQAGEEAVSEAPQSAVEQFAQNLGLRDANPDQRLDEGVLNSAITGGIVGAAMGGATGGAGAAVGSSHGTKDQKPGPKADSAAKKTAAGDAEAEMRRRLAGEDTPLPAGPEVTPTELDLERVREGQPALPKPRTLYGEGFTAQPDETPGRIAKGALPAGPEATPTDLDIERIQEGQPALPKPRTAYGDGFAATPTDQPDRIAKGRLPAGPDVAQSELDAERFREGPPALPKPETIYGEGFTAVPERRAGEPTEAQKAAGNYPKRAVRFQGLPVSIETEAGQIRRGQGADGKPWAVEMPAPYGYVKRTEGADGDQVDVYLGPDERTDKVFVIDQIDPETGRFDEHKALMGFRTEAEARKVYEAAFSDGSGPARAGAITTMPVRQFKGWLKGDTTKPVAYRQKPVALVNRLKQLGYKLPEINAMARDQAAGLAQRGVAREAPVPVEQRTATAEIGALPRPLVDRLRRLGYPDTDIIAMPRERAVGIVQRSVKGPGRPAEPKMAPQATSAPPAPEADLATLPQGGKPGEQPAAAATPAAKPAAPPAVTPERAAAVQKWIANNKERAVSVAAVARDLNLEHDEAARVLDHLAGQRKSIRKTDHGYRRIGRSFNRPETLAEFLAANGGIRDQGGELAAMDLAGAFPVVPGAGPLVRANGRTLDAARELAAEAGYLGAADDGKTTVNDLLDALDREARASGEKNWDRRVWSHHDASEVADYLDTRRTKDQEASRKARRASLEDQAEQLGIEVQAAWDDETLIFEIADRAATLDDPDALLRAAGATEAAIDGALAQDDFQFPGFDDDLKAPETGAEGGVGIPQPEDVASEDDARGGDQADAEPEPAPEPDAGEAPGRDADGRAGAREVPEADAGPAAIDEDAAPGGASEPGDEADTADTPDEADSGVDEGKLRRSIDRETAERYAIDLIRDGKSTAGFFPTENDGYITWGVDQDPHRGGGIKGKIVIYDERGGRFLFSVKDIRAKARPAVEPAPAKAATTKPAYGNTNKLFTADAAAAARALLKKKLGGSQLNAGLDPEIVQAGITLAGWHIEAGARKFADFTKAMIDDLGEAVRPYLRSWYEGVRYFPGFDAEGMSTSAEIEQTSAQIEAAPVERPMPDRADPLFEKKNTLRQLLNTLDKGIHPQGRPFTPDERKRWQVNADELAAEIEAGGPELANSSQSKTPAPTDNDAFAKAIHKKGEAIFEDRWRKTAYQLRKTRDGGTWQVEYFDLDSPMKGREVLRPEDGAHWTRSQAADNAIRHTMRQASSGDIVETMPAEAATKPQNPSSPAPAAAGTPAATKPSGSGTIPEPETPAPATEARDEQQELPNDLFARDAGSGAQDAARPAKGRDAAGARPAKGDRGEPASRRDRGADGEGRGQERPGSARARDRDGAGDAARLPEGRPAGGDQPKGADPTPAAERPDRDVRGVNYAIAPGALDEARGPKAKARDNLEAIRLVKAIDAEGRPATREEQEKLARYVGWGGLAQAFPDSSGTIRPEWKEIGDQLADLLTPTEYQTASRSTQYAHYTSETVVRAMYDAVARMGFKGGQVFEPGMGIGNFAGMMPADMAAASQYAGVEMDHVTARIAAQLYPQWGVRRGDFTRIPLPPDTFDMAIGNPPFADVVIRADAKYAKNGFYLHDYFFAKTLDGLRPGGILAFVTSAGTMNKLDTAPREYLADRADLLGAIRLPDMAFKRNAGTQVTTDIIFLRKRLPGETPGDRTWTETTVVSLPGPDGKPREGNVNRYFAEHPEMVLGEPNFADKLYEGRYAVSAPNDYDLAGKLAEAIAALPSAVYAPASTTAPRAGEIDVSTDEKKEGSYYIGKDDKLMQYRDGVGRPVAMRGQEGGRLTKADAQKIRDMVPVRDALRAVFAAQLNEAAGNLDGARKRLHKAYDAFVAKHGPINRVEYTERRPSPAALEEARAEARNAARMNGEEFYEGTADLTDLLTAKKPDGTRYTNSDIAALRQAEREKVEAAGGTFDEGDFNPEEVASVITAKYPNMDAFAEDPENYRVRTIEDYDDATDKGRKGRIFTENTIRAEKRPEITTTADALNVTLNETGRVDIDRIAEIVKQSPDQVIEDLGAAIYQVPGTDGTWVTADDYLSGPVRDKLKAAEAAAKHEPALARNVEALKAVQPKDHPPSQISARLGAPWVPPADVEVFAKERLGFGATVKYLPALAAWNVDGKEENAATTSTWGTKRRDAYELLADALNFQQPAVYDYDEDRKRTLNKKETEAAQAKLDAIREAFEDWIWKDGDRATRLARIYNDRFNNLVARQFDGSHLTTPGLSAHFSLRPHQKRVVWRIVQTGNTYMAHTVGAGKTSAMISAGMEMKRLGLVNKPMYAVPNHMLAQFAKEFLEQYPMARVMVADDARFHTSRRRQFMADVAASDIDAVVITHASFGKIPISDQFQAQLIEKEIDLYKEVLEELDGEDRVGRKRVEKQIERMENRLVGRETQAKDQTLTFEEMGIDFLFVDEAHLFRKLDFSTKQGNIKGIASQGSKMAWDLYVKSRYLQQQRPDRNLVLASGTPITNTLAELYTVERYLAEGELEKQGIAQFDNWAGVFGTTRTRLEKQPSGGYKPVTRFAKFTNLAELSAMFRDVADIVTSDDLTQYVTRPAIRGGKINLVLAKPSFAFKAYQKRLGERMQEIANRTGAPQKGDDIMLTVINDGRHSAIDMRLIDPSADNDPGSKLNLMVDKMFTIWAETRDREYVHPVTKKPQPIKGATQIVFSDLGIKRRYANGKTFSAYDYIKSELIRRGVPARQIAFMRDYSDHAEKQRLFNDVNDGKVAFLIGSTGNMGTGVNAQRRVVALHNLDAPWYPADLTQRIGRGHRQGNQNDSIGVFGYATEESYDATMWDLLALKQGFIDQIMSGAMTDTEVEDVGEADQYAVAAALATGDPRVIRQAELQEVVNRLRRQQGAHNDDQVHIRREIADAKAGIEYRENRVQQIQTDLAARVETKGDAFKMTVDGKTFTDRGDAGRALFEAMEERVAAKDMGQHKLGTVGGFDLRFEVVKTDSGKVAYNPPEIVMASGHTEYVSLGEVPTARGVMQSIEGILRNLDTKEEAYRDAIAGLQRRIKEYEARTGVAFAKADELKKAQAELKAINDALSAEVPKVVATEGPQSPLADDGQAIMVDEDQDGDDAPASAKRTGGDRFKRSRGDAFARWFGDSKVVDSEGEPLRMYHGTSKDQDFTKFNVGQRGAWFTSDPESASSYAAENDARQTVSAIIGRKHTADRVIPVYLSIRNPYRPTDQDTATMRASSSYIAAQRALVIKAKQAGHDGIEFGGGVWIAFRPEQIKSATGNAGTYNSDSPDIRFKRGEAAVEPDSETDILAERRVTGQTTGVDRAYSPEFRAKLDAFRDKVFEFSRRVAPGLDVQTFDQLWADIGQGMQAQVQGAYDLDRAQSGGGHLAAIALTSPDGLGTAAHEIIHYLRAAGAIGDQEWEQLTRRATESGLSPAEVEKMRAFQDRREGEGDPLKRAEAAALERLEARASWSERFRIAEHYDDFDADTQAEEAIAEAFGAYVNGRLQVPPGLRRVFEMVKAFLERARNWLNGEGFTRPEDIFAAAERGEIGARVAPYAFDQRRRKGGDQFQAAWHGTPHDFDKFTTDKIGTGEGAQAYGWGLYFAGNRKVAEFYRNKLALDDGKIDLRKEAPINQDERDFLKFYEEAQALYEKSDQFDPSSPFVIGDDLFDTYSERIIASGDYQRFADADRAMRQRVREKSQKGRLYNVDLAPADDEWLDWDKKISQQSDKVKAGLRKLGWAVDKPNLFARMLGMEATGKEYYDGIAQEMAGNRELPWGKNSKLKRYYTDERAASLALHKAGIPGIRYLDGGSRSRGEGTYNYVVFDDAAVKILDKFQRRKDAALRDTPDGSIDRTEAGEQTVLPGAERITDRALAERRMQGRKGTDRAQAAAGDLPLFDTGARGQGTLFSRKKGAATRDVSQTDPTAGANRTPDPIEPAPEGNLPTRLRGTPEQEAAIAKVMAPPDRRGLVQQAKDWMAEVKVGAKDRVLQGVFDQFHALKVAEQRTFGKQLDASVSAYEAALRTRNLDSVMSVVMKHNPLRYDKAQGVFEPLAEYEDGTKTKGFVDIFEPLARSGKLELWKGYAVARRAKRLLQEGRERILDDADITALLALGKEHPEFDGVFQEWQRFNRAMLDMAEAADLINKEQRALWERSDYIPFYRVMDEQDGVAAPGKNHGITGQRSGIKQLKGGENQLNDIVENMVMNMTKLVDASFKNVAARRMVALLDGTEALTRQAKSFEQVYGITEADAAKALGEIGIADADKKAAALSLYAMASPRAPDVVSVMVGGNPRYYTVNDPLLLRAVTALRPEQTNAITRVMGLAKRTLTHAVTLDPAFMIRNAIRDTLAASIQTTERGLIPGVSAATGFTKALREDPSLVAIMAAGGGSGAGFYDTSPKAVRKELERRLGSDDRSRIVDSLAKAKDLYLRIGSASEAANRIAIYDAAIKDGATKAQAVAEAQDLLNFTMRGDFAAVRFLTEVVPFMNARLQGLYKLGRAAGHNPKAMLLRGALLMAATLALMGANWDDDEYWDLEEWDRDTYYHVKIGKAWWRIPKPFEVGAVFSTIPERLAGLKKEGRPDLFAKSMLRMIEDTFAMNPVPQISKPILEQYANKNSFTGRPIVSRGLENLQPGAQASPFTSETMKQLGKALGLSPVRMEALLRGYFGTLGTYALAATDAAVAAAVDAPVRPDRRPDQIGILGSFYRGEADARRTRWEEEFYRYKEQADQAYSTIKRYREAGETATADTIERDAAAPLAARRQMNRIDKSLQDLRAEQRQVYNSRELTGAEKRRRLDALQADLTRRTGEIKGIRARAEASQP